MMLVFMAGVKYLARCFLIMRCTCIVLILHCCLADRISIVFIAIIIIGSQTMQFVANRKKNPALCVPD